MPLTTDPVFPVDSFTVEPWPDPVIDELGHDPRSTYVERFWLPVLGPSTVWFLRRVADELDQRPEGFEPRPRRHRSIPRCRHAGWPQLAHAQDDRAQLSIRCRAHARATAIGVRRRLAPLTRVQVERLPRTAAGRAHELAGTTSHGDHRREDEGAGPIARPVDARDRRGHRRRRTAAAPLAVPPRGRPRGRALGARRPRPDRSARPSPEGPAGRWPSPCRPAASELRPPTVTSAPDDPLDEAG